MAQNTSKRIFICYRRTTQGSLLANNIFLGLENYFGDDIFFDRSTIDSGDFFEEKIEKALRNAKIFLPIIHGDEWFTLRGEADEYGNSSPRLFEPGDWVTREIKTALDLKRAKQCTIIPIVAGGVKLWPKKDTLGKAAPEVIHSLFKMDYFKYSPSESIYHIQRLFSKINKYLDDSSNFISLSKADLKKGKEMQKAAKKIIDKEDLIVKNPDQFCRIMDQYLSIFDLNVNKPNQEVLSSKNLKKIKDKDKGEVYYIDHEISLSPQSVLFEPLSIDIDPEAFKGRIIIHLSNPENRKTRTFFMLYDIFETSEGQNWLLKKGTKEKIQQLEDLLIDLGAKGSLYIPRLDQLFRSEAPEG